uniref:DNA-directed DNA polymerase n=1 Tax=Lentinula edodes TaxID=5353 RepID=A0A343C5H0_LENED|nr:hypothetical protein [Lentinula edodes]
MAFIIYYTDTDSIFTDYDLNPEEIGSDIGLMKDELKSNLISEAYFLGIKQYGYYYYDKNTNERIEKSVFAGVIRDSLTFNEIKKIFNGKTIEKETSTRFYKSLKNLNITIKNIKISIKKNNTKLLLNNNYIPITIII